jgi:ParB family chromosome partitioning protein
MHSQNIQLKDLHVSPFNMRAEKKEPSLKRMAEIAANIIPTAREKGILQDIIVRPNNRGFEILAGRRRFYAARVIEAERGSFDPIKCDVREVDDAGALEISLIENVAREDADELAEYETYAGLIKLGKKPGDIALTFGITEHKVTQRLALANLLPAIRDLFRCEELDPGDLQLLTMATKTQQRDWLKLYDDHDAPTGHQLKGWLFGGAAIQTKYALFDLASYSGKIVGDLFSEDGYFAKGEDFWTAQDEAIAARRDTYLTAKWPEVVVMERGTRFPEWDFVKTSKKAGGRVYIEPTHTGEVRFHEGYLTQGEASKAKKRKGAAKTVDDAEEKDAAASRSPITKTMQNYLDLHRHAAVRLAVIARPADALRLMIAHAVAASGNWSVRPDARRAENDAVQGSVGASEAQSLFEAEAKQVRKLLAPAFKGEGDDDEDGTVAGHCHDDSLTVGVFQRLLKLKDTDVARIAAFVMAETLASGSDVTGAFGAFAKVEARAHWTPDQAFFDHMRDRVSVNGMLADLSGKKAADKLVSAKLKDQKAALAAAAAASTDWCPGWMAFPATGL